MRRSLGVLGLVVTAAISGCTVNGPDPAPSPEPPDAGDGAALNLPKRPAELPVAGKSEQEICAWIRDDQQAQLAIGKPSPAAGNNKTGAPTCTWLGDDGNARFGVNLSVVPQGLTQYSKQINATPETTRTYDVNGFGAVQTQVPGGESLGCSVFVDAAQGQTLFANLALLSPGKMTSDQMCTKAKQAAEAAVTTLQGQG